MELSMDIILRPVNYNIRRHILERVLRPTKHAPPPPQNVVCMEEGIIAQLRQGPSSFLLIPRALHRLCQ